MSTKTSSDSMLMLTAPLDARKPRICRRCGLGVLHRRATIDPSAQAPWPCSRPHEALPPLACWVRDSAVTVAAAVRDLRHGKCWRSLGSYLAQCLERSLWRSPSLSESPC